MGFVDATDNSRIFALFAGKFFRVFRGELLLLIS